MLNCARFHRSYSLTNSSSLNSFDYFSKATAWFSLRTLSLSEQGTVKIPLNT